MSEQEFTFRRRGAACNGGKICAFDYFSVLVMRGWPAVAAWKKTREHPAWFPCRPELNRDAQLGLEDSLRVSEPVLPNSRTAQQLWLPFPDLEYDRLAKRVQAWAEWFRPVPREIRHSLLGFRSRRYHVLSLLGRVPEARDLLDNPSLLFMLAQPWVFNRAVVSRSRIKWAKQRVGWKRRKILASLCWPCSDEIDPVRLVAKVVAPSISVNGLLYLRGAINDADTAKVVAHLPRINAGAILLVSHPALRGVAAPSLVTEAATDRSEDRAPRVGWVLRDALDMLDMMERPRYGAFRSIRAVMAIHDDLAARIGLATAPSLSKPFPPPPLAGCPEVIPITSGKALLQESDELCHCAASRAPAILAGREFLYSVRGPLQRATLSLRRRGNTWVIGELRGRMNEEPLYSTVETIIMWFYAQGVGDKARGLKNAGQEADGGNLEADYRADGGDE